MRTLKQGLRAGLAAMAVGSAAATSALILVLLSPPAVAAIDCWVDAEHSVTGDQRPVTDPAVAPMRQALRTVNAGLHAQRELHELPRSRLRSSWLVGGQWDSPARAGRLLVRDHRESMWLRDRCDVNPQADRLGPMAAVVVALNVPTSFFESEGPNWWSRTEATRQNRLLARSPNARANQPRWRIGINDGAAAGQTIRHLHTHLIPQYPGDRPDPRGSVRWVIPDKADYRTERDQAQST